MPEFEEPFVIRVILFLCSSLASIAWISFRIRGRFRRVFRQTAFPFTCCAERRRRTRCACFESVMPQIQLANGIYRTT